LVSHGHPFMSDREPRAVVFRPVELERNCAAGKRETSTWSSSRCSDAGPVPTSCSKSD